MDQPNSVISTQAVIRCQTASGLGAWVTADGSPKPTRLLVKFMFGGQYLREITIDPSTSAEFTNRMGQEVVLVTVVPNVTNQFGITYLNNVTVTIRVTTPSGQTVASYVY